MIAAILIVLAIAADPEPCRDALANYNDMVVAIHAAIRDYERCVTASLARDDCGAEFIELQVTHRDYEAAVMERADKCRGTANAE